MDDVGGHPGVPSADLGVTCLGDNRQGTDLVLYEKVSLSPQLTMRLGVILNISCSKPGPISVPPVFRTSASPRISIPRTRQGSSEAMSSSEG